MKITGKLTTKLLSITLAAVISLFAVGGSAFAEGISYKWSVDWSAEKQDDWLGWKGNGSTKFFTDDTVHTPTSPYSIKIDNTDYNIAYVERTYNVEPSTRYKFSAMVKYSGFKRDPRAAKKATGARVGIDYSNVDTGFSTANDWTLLEFEFTTGSDETTRNLRLQNGRVDGCCKGTAWFSDVKLEKADVTNNWNILAVFFRNADANVVIDGRRVRFQNSLTENNINEINKYALDTLPENLKALSNGKLTVNSIDRYYSDEAITEKDLTTFEYGYCVNEKNSPVLNKVLDKYLAQKHYNQIIIFVPFIKQDIISLTDGWWGLGGTTYKDVYFAQITNSWDGAFEIGDDFRGNVSVHEMCHCLENESKIIDPGKTPDFHSVLEDYPDPNVSTYEKIHMFMTASLPDGKGLDPSVFNSPNGKYILVSDDMSTGEGIMPISSAAAPPAPKNFKAEATSDDEILISWDAVPNASGYRVSTFKDPGFRTIWQTFDWEADTTGFYLGPIAKGERCYCTIRTLYTVNGTNYYSDPTYLTYTHLEKNVVRGDIDNSGSFDFDDISVAITYFLNGTKIDDRTAEAMGITGRNTMDFDDVQTLISWFLEKM